MPTESRSLSCCVLVKLKHVDNSKELAVPPETKPEDQKISQPIDRLLIATAEHRRFNEFCGAYTVGTGIAHCFGRPGVEKDAFGQPPIRA